GLPDAWHQRSAHARLHDVRQQPFTVATDLPSLLSRADLVRALTARGVQVQLADRAVYVPPQAGPVRLLGDLATYYPPGTGLLIAAPDQPGRDLGGEAAAAMLLHAAGLGPRLYDYLTLTAGATSLACLAVDHVDGEAPSADEAAIFS